MFQESNYTGNRVLPQRSFIIFANSSDVMTEITLNKNQLGPFNERYQAGGILSRNFRFPRRRLISGCLGSRQSGIFQLISLYLGNGNIWGKQLITVTLCPFFTKPNIDFRQLCKIVFFERFLIYLNCYRVDWEKQQVLEKAIYFFKYIDYILSNNFRIVNYYQNCKF